jgi:hypothetical protein
MLVFVPKNISPYAGVIKKRTAMRAKQPVPVSQNLHPGRALNRVISMVNYRENNFHLCS